MFTWIWVFLLYSWKIETLFQKLKDQKLQTMQLKQINNQVNVSMGNYFIHLYGKSLLGGHLMINVLLVSA